MRDPSEYDSPPRWVLYLLKVVIIAILLTLSFFLLRWYFDSMDFVRAFVLVIGFGLGKILRIPE